MTASFNKIRSLEATDFDARGNVKGAGKKTLVMFYTESCPACVAFKPVFGAAAGQLGTVGNFARVRLPPSAALESKMAGFPFTVRGVPTVASYDESGRFTGIYEGARTVDAMRAHLSSSSNTQRPRYLTRSQLKK